MGRDADYEGLRAPQVLSEEAAPVLDGGRTIHMENLFASVEHETASVFDREVGESSDSDDDS